MNNGFPIVPLPAWVGFVFHMALFMGQIMIMVSHKLDSDTKTAVVGTISLMQGYLGQQAYRLNSEGKRLVP